MISALVFGAIAIHYIIKMLGKMSFAVFAIYRVILGAAIFFFQ